MNIFFITIIVALKFVVPALMLKLPFVGLWGNYLLDSLDGDLLQFLEVSEQNYQLIDKFADYVSYIFMLMLAWRWRIRKTILVLFLYRTIGQALYFITGNELMFFYFQNFMEPLMMIYALVLLKTKNEEHTYEVYKKHLILIWIIVIGYKLWNEWYLHFANIDLSTIFFGINGGS